MAGFGEVSALDAAHNAYDVFRFTLEALASSPEEQCQIMGDFNTAWELRDDALCARYLVGSGLFSSQQEAAVSEFLAAVEPIPVNDMPSGAGRAVNLAAMQHPSWQPVREMAQALLVALEPVTRANQAYLGRLADAP